MDDEMEYEMHRETESNPYDTVFDGSTDTTDTAAFNANTSKFG